MDGEFQPTGGNFRPMTNRGIAQPELRFFDEPSLGRGGFSILQHHALAELLDGILLWLALHLYPIGFRQFVAGITDAVLEAATVG